MMLFPVMKPAAWLSAALLLFCFATRLMATEVGYQDRDGVWRTIDSTQWPAHQTQAPGAMMRLQATGITFSVQYDDVADHTGVGFDDPTQGATRRATISAVLAYINSVIKETGACQLEFMDSMTLGTNTLAQGGPFFFTSGAHFQQPFPLKHITTGTDPDSSVPDIQITVDFGWNWYSGTGTTPSNQLDLFSVLLHEITHGLGIISLTKSDGTSPYAGIFTTWDDLLYTGQGTKLWNANGVLNGSASLVAGAQGGVFFTGAQATATLGSHPPVYDPNPFQVGSSIGHWDTSVSSKAVMRPAIGNGTMNRQYQPFEISTLKDLGYKLNVKALNAVQSWTGYR